MRLAALEVADNMSATVLGWRFGEGTTFIDVDPPEPQEGVASPPSLAELIGQAQAEARARWGLVPTT